MNYIYIVCHSFYDVNGKHQEIGGVQTYVECLLALSSEMGWHVTILQYSPNTFNRLLLDGNRLLSWQNRQQLQSTLAGFMKENHGLAIYSDYWCVPNVLEHPCIVLQHGVGWDYSATTLKNPLLKRLNGIRKRINRLILFKKLRKIALEADCVLCVDTNFRNWLQATFPFDDWGDRIIYIPNFSQLPSQEAMLARWNKIDTNLRCIFPRRFAEIRGAILFSNVCVDLAKDFPNVEFGFIGDGECEQKMRRILRSVPRVEIYSRAYSEMGEEYLKADIAVIPTLASEGTSLSCIEAMAAGCAVVATTVGGLGNLIIPGFNGCLCQPSHEQLRSSLQLLFSQPTEVKRLGRNARLVAEEALSYQIWKNRVKKVLMEIIEK